jgi:hypothetical protein
MATSSYPQAEKYRLILGRMIPEGRSTHLHIIAFLSATGRNRSNQGQAVTSA